jgi:hypothetical protein
METSVCPSTTQQAQKEKSKGTKAGFGSMATEVHPKKQRFGEMPLEMSIYQNFDNQTLSTLQMYRLVEEIKTHFNITNTTIIANIYDIYTKLDAYKYMGDNIGLYKVALLFLYHLEKKVPVMFSNQVVIPFNLVLAIMITHKYFVDNPFNNESIALLFRIPLKRVNEMEINIFKLLDHKLPFGFRRKEME